MLTTSAPGVGGKLLRTPSAVGTVRSPWETWWLRRDTVDLLLLSSRPLGVGTLAWSRGVIDDGGGGGGGTKLATEEDIEDTRGRGTDGREGAKEEPPSERPRGPEEPSRGRDSPYGELREGRAVELWRLLYGVPAPAWPAARPAGTAW